MIIKRIISPATPPVISKIYSLLLTINADTIGKFLIYADPAYRPYLEKIINNGDNDYFYIAETDSGIAGFAHFKSTSSANLHLNNIIIAKPYRGNNNGRTLLAFAIDELKYMLPTLETFSLDVFAGNGAAFDWYKKMGLSVAKQNKWYDVTGIFIPLAQTGTQGRLLLHTDTNGFTGVYKGSVKIASVINHRTLVFRDETILSGNLPGLKALFKNNGYSNAVLITDNEHNYSVWDISYRMTVHINNIMI